MKGVDDDLHVDLSHALERSPVGGILIEEFSRGVNLNMAHAKVAGVPLEQAYLLVTEYDCLALGLFLQPQQSLVTMCEIVPEPDLAYARGTDVHARKGQFVGDALGAPSGSLKTQGQYLLLDLPSYAVRIRTPRTAFLLNESGDASDLKGAAHFVERVAVVAHDPAGLRYVAELLGELKQRQFAFRTFCNSGHRMSPYWIGSLRKTQSTGDPGVRPFFGRTVG